MAFFGIFFAFFTLPEKAMHVMHGFFSQAWKVKSSEGVALDFNDATPTFLLHVSIFCLYCLHFDLEQVTA